MDKLGLRSCNTGFKSHYLPYYINRYLVLGGEQYYKDPTQWQSPQNGDQQMKLPPPPGFMATPGGGWGAPPPPPPVNTSSDCSSVNSGQHPTPMIAPSPNIGAMSQFSYEDLAAATNGFSQANLLGQGGFGYVYKGVLPDKRVVAVKSLKSGSGQGEREFQAEVEIISRVHHRHLVSLVGYCIANGQRMLVYEFVPNKTLEFHLHGIYNFKEDCLSFDAGNEKFYLIFILLLKEKKTNI